MIGSDARAPAAATMEGLQQEQEQQQQSPAAAKTKIRRVRITGLDAIVAVEQERISALLLNIGAWDYRPSITVPDEVKALETFILTSLKTAQDFTFSQRIDALKLEDVDRIETLKNSYGNISLKISAEISANISKFLDERIQMDRKSLLYTRDRFIKEIGDLRDANEQFRSTYETASMARESEQCRLFEEDLQVTYDHNQGVLMDEAIDLRQRLRKSEVFAESLTKQVASLEREIETKFRYMGTYKQAYDLVMSKKKKKKGATAPLSPPFKIPDPIDIPEGGGEYSQAQMQTNRGWNRGIQVDPEDFPAYLKDIGFVVDASSQYEVNPTSTATTAAINNNNSSSNTAAIGAISTTGTNDNISTIDDSMFMTITTQGAAVASIISENSIKEMKEAVELQFKTEISTKDAEIASLKSSLSVCEEELATLKPIVTRLEEEVTAQKSRIAQVINDKVIEIDKISNDFFSEKLALTSSNKSLLEDISKLKSDVSRLKVVESGLHTDNATLTDTIRKLHMKIQSDLELEKLRRAQQEANDQEGQSKLLEKEKEAEAAFAAMMDAQLDAIQKQKDKEELWERERFALEVARGEEQQRLKELEIDMANERESFLNQREALLQENNEVTEKMEYFRAENDKNVKLGDELLIDNDRMREELDKLSEEKRSIENEFRASVALNTELQSKQLSLESEVALQKSAVMNLTNQICALTETIPVPITREDVETSVNFDEQRMGGYIATINELEERLSDLQKQLKQQQQQLNEKLEDDRAALLESPQLLRTGASLDLESVGNSLFNVLNDRNEDNSISFNSNNHLHDQGKTNERTTKKKERTNGNKGKSEEKDEEEYGMKSSSTASSTKYLKEDYEAIAAKYYTDQIQDLLYSADTFTRENKALAGKNLFHVITKDCEQVRAKFLELIELCKKLHFNGNHIREQNEFLNNKLRVQRDKTIYDTKLNELKMKEKSLLLALLSEEVTQLRQTVVTMQHESYQHQQQLKQQQQHQHQHQMQAGLPLKHGARVASPPDLVAISDDDVDNFEFNNSNSNNNNKQRLHSSQSTNNLPPVKNLSDSFKRPSTSSADRDLADERITFAVKPGSFSRNLESRGESSSSVGGVGGGGVGVDSSSFKSSNRLNVDTNVSAGGDLRPISRDGSPTLRTRTPIGTNNHNSNNGLGLGIGARSLMEYSRPSTSALRGVGQDLLGGLYKDPRMLELANIRGLIVDMVEQMEKKLPVPLQTAKSSLSMSMSTVDLRRAKEDNLLASREVSLTKSFNSDIKSTFKR